MAFGNERRKVKQNEDCQRVIFAYKRISLIARLGVQLSPCKNEKSAISGRGEIGRRAGFRFLWVTPCGFKSLRPHHDWTVILIQEKYQNYRLFYIKTIKKQGFERKNLSKSCFLGCAYFLYATKSLKIWVIVKIIGNR